MKPSKYFLILTIHYSRSIYKKEKPVAYIIISTESKTLLSPNKYMRNNYLNHFNNRAVIVLIVFIIIYFCLVFNKTQAP